MFFVNIGEQAPVGNVNIADGSEGGRGAHNHYVFAEGVAVAHVGKGSHFTGDGIGELHTIAQVCQIIHAKRGAFASFEPFLLVGDYADAVDHESVGAQVGYFVRHINIEAVEHGDDGDESGDGEDHTQQGQESSQLMRAQGIQR